MENDLEVTDEAEREGSDSTCHVNGCLVSLPTSISTSTTKLFLQFGGNSDHEKRVHPTNGQRRLQL
jgi:hypothetical protein